ncbi:hypothetical protein ACWGTI_32710, partial [Mesorhizobium sp. ArgA1]
MSGVGEIQLIDPAAATRAVRSDQLGAANETLHDRRVDFGSLHCPLDAELGASGRQRRLRLIFSQSLGFWQKTGSVCRFETPKSQPRQSVLQRLPIGDEVVEVQRL